MGESLPWTEPLSLTVSHLFTPHILRPSWSLFIHCRQLKQHKTSPPPLRRTAWTQRTSDITLPNNKSKKKNVECGSGTKHLRSEINEVPDNKKKKIIIKMCLTYRVGCREGQSITHLEYRKQN